MTSKKSINPEIQPKHHAILQAIAYYMQHIDQHNVILG